MQTDFVPPLALIAHRGQVILGKTENNGQRDKLCKIYSDNSKIMGNLDAFDKNICCDQFFLSRFWRIFTNNL